MEILLFIIACIAVAVVAARDTARYRNRCAGTYRRRKTDHA